MAKQLIEIIEEFSAHSADALLRRADACESAAA
jgi:hypothetical protein